METRIADQPSVNRMTFRGLFRIKSLDSILRDAEEPEHQLKRALGPIQLTLFGIGAIIGAGIFATIGTAAAGDANRPGAGPALMVSFVITAIVCGFTALCYAEFASMVPISGSAYTYSYATLGEVIAWIIGWDLIIEYAVGNIAVAISWANYFKTLLAGLHVPGLAPNGIIIPDWISMDYRTAAKVPGVLESAPHPFGFPIVFNVLAVSIVFLITVVLVWGIRESARFNATMVVIKILVLTFFIIVGFTYVQPANWTPFNPNGFGGISAGAAIVFFAYIGFDAVSTVAEETKNPQRNLPIGIIASLIICTIFYAVVAAVFTGLISYPELKAKLATEQAEPLTMALQHVGQQFNTNLGWAVGIVAFGSVIAHTAVLLVFQLGQPRIFFSMARDGLLPPIFYKVHPRFRTPHISTILTGVFVAAFAAVASIDEMVDLTNIGTLFAFILVCAGIIVLRVRDPARHRPFRVPGGLIIPILGIASCLYLIYYLPPTSWLRFAAWLNFGFVIYVGYSAVHSRLTGRQHAERVAEHNAQTAYTGAWLAIIGIGLLVFMRGFDLWLEALKTHEDSTGVSKMASAVGDVLKTEPWMEVSWFLIVPLALNAFVLCPIVIRRALKARREGGDLGQAGITSSSLVVAIVLAAISVVYLVLVARHNL
ncbi:MAG TPA: amino acid permease [Blastocatellia bacterium]|nr:amino acid permease [Blastocatellia bacterium]